MKLTPEELRQLLLSSGIPYTINIPGGCFVMGENAGRLNERPSHLVKIGPFAMGVVPVTRSHYDFFLVATARTAPGSWDHPGFADPLLPALSVSWYDAVAYCAWLSARTGERFRLPTEAEREYAARGGVEGASYPWGDEYPDPACSYTLEPYSAPLPVPSGAPNGFGLYNMGDTVHEWCQDYYEAGFYTADTADNPTGPAGGESRVACGGAWRHQVPVSRCAHRTSLPPDRHFTDFGFRVVRDSITHP